MTQKLVSVVEMTHLCAAQYTFVLVRPKIEVKLSTQSADEWICMGKWTCEILAIVFLENEKARENRTFLS